MWGNDKVFLNVNGSFHDFPRLARESGFHFNLFRGRVDWKKIGAIDIDRVIRERDLETLQAAFTSVTSCSLEREYDLKVLDPNFVKLFHLGQLAVDYLQYCCTYLEHCIIALQQQLRIALQKIEKLQKTKQLIKEEKLRLICKKMQDQMKPGVTQAQPSTFQCHPCSKTFREAKYLQSHFDRKHAGHFSESLDTRHNKEIEKLSLQVSHLQERLQFTEEILRKHQNQELSPVLTETEIKPTKERPSEFGTGPENRQTLMEAPETAAQSSAPKQQTESQNAERQHSFYLHAEYEAERANLLEFVGRQNNEIRSLRREFSQQQEIWQNRLYELQQLHQRDLKELRQSLSFARGAVPSASNFTESGSVTHIHNEQDNRTLGPKKFQNDIEDDDRVSTFDQRSFQQESKKEATENLQQFKTDTSKQPSTNTFEKTPKESVLPSVRGTREPAFTQNSSTSSTDSEPKPPKRSLSYSHKISSSAKNSDPPFDNSQTPIKSMYQEAGDSTGSSDSESLSESNQYSTTDDEEAPHPPKKTKSISPKLEVSPEILAGLKEDLQLLLERRLRELGVDPEWEGLPAITFRNNMATLRHHQNITAKTHKSFFGIREDISSEVDRRVQEEIKNKTAKKSSTKEKVKKSPSSNGSRSFLSRIKSSVKNKLYNQSQTKRSSVSNLQALVKDNKDTDKKENIYSQGPKRSDTSVKSTTSLHEHEAVAKTSTKEKTKEENTKEIALEDVPDAVSSQTDRKNGLKKKSNFSEMDMDNLSQESNRFFDLQINESGVGKLRDVTVSPSKLPSSSETIIELHTPQPMRIRDSKENENSSQSLSEIDSISGLDSDLNEILDIPVSIPPARPRTTRTTPELLADVAKLRESSRPLTLSHSAMKSNLKSSFSTGSISKKRVAFQDEQDGFNTIELGPALTLTSTVRTQSTVSLDSFSGTSRPIPLPRASSTAASFSVDSNIESDWDYPNEFADIFQQTSSIHTVNSPQKALGRGISASVPDNTIKSTSHVSQIIRNFENSKSSKPFMGVNIFGALQPLKTTTPPTVASGVITGSKLRDQENDINLNNREPSTSGLEKNHPNEDSFASDLLLLDDFSSS